MKPNPIFLIACALLIACNNNKIAQESTATKTELQPEVASNAETNQTSGDGIVGNWKLRLEVFDDNGNRVPDEEEMKKGYDKNYALQLNADGSCRMQQMFMGRYEKVTENGREMLKVYRKKMEGDEGEPAPDIYQITSVKKDELVLQIIIAGEPSSFWFFKRTN